MTIHFVTGLLDDGSALNSVMPRDTATALSVVVGETSEVRVRLYYPSGVAVDINALSGWAAQLDVNCTVDPCQRLPDYRIPGVLVAGDVLGNALVFVIPSGTFRGAVPGRFFWDVWLTSGVQRWQIVRTGAWHLQGGLARP